MKPQSNERIVLDEFTQRFGYVCENNDIKRINREIMSNQVGQRRLIGKQVGFPGRISTYTLSKGVTIDWSCCWFFFLFIFNSHSTNAARKYLDKIMDFHNRVVANDKD